MEGVGQVREGEVGNQFSVLEYFWVEFLMIRFKMKCMFILVLGFSWRFCKQFIFLLILLIFEFQKEFRVLRVLVFFIVTWVVFVGVGFVVRESQGFRGGQGNVDCSFGLFEGQQQVVLDFCVLFFGLLFSIFWEGCFQGVRIFQGS